MQDQVLEYLYIFIKKWDFLLKNDNMAPNFLIQFLPIFHDFWTNRLEKNFVVVVKIQIICTDLMHNISKND